MTPCGERGFGDVASAKAAAQKRVNSYVIIMNVRRPFMPAEFAWVAPIEFYVGRAMQAATAGISVVEMVKE